MPHATTTCGAVVRSWPCSHAQYLQCVGWSLVVVVSVCDLGLLLHLEGALLLGLVDDRGDNKDLVVVTIVDLPKSVLFPVVMGVVVSDDIIPAAVVGDHVCCCCC